MLIEYDDDLRSSTPRRKLEQSSDNTSIKLNLRKGVKVHARAEVNSKRRIQHSAARDRVNYNTTFTQVQFDVVYRPAPAFGEAWTIFKSSVVLDQHFVDLSSVLFDTGDQRSRLW